MLNKDYNYYDKPFNMTAIIFSIWLDWIACIVEITFFQIFLGLGSYQSDVVATWDPQIIGPIAGGNKLENICSIKKITNLEVSKSWIRFKISYQLDGHK